MQDRKNGGERMEAVLLGLTPEVRVSDRQSPLAGALRRELAAVTGLAVTALDLDPRVSSRRRPPGVSRFPTVTST